jgi:alpha-galactosidase
LLQHTDYVKLDWCGDGVGENGTVKGQQCGPSLTEDECKEERFTRFSHALNKTGRSIYLAASSVIGTPQWAPKTLNSWRIGGDHHDWWWTNQTGSWMQNSSTRQKIENLDRANKVQMADAPAGTPLAGPGGWNDADFLFTGGQGCGTATGDNPERNGSTFKAHCPMQSEADYRTAYTMWAIGSAPLLVAVDVANMTAVERSTLTNGAVAKMHLDPLGRVGTSPLLSPLACLFFFLLRFAGESCTMWRSMCSIVLFTCWASDRLY